MSYLEKRANEIGGRTSERIVEIKERLRKEAEAEILKTFEEKNQRLAEYQQVKEMYDSLQPSPLKESIRVGLEATERELDAYPADQDVQRAYQERFRVEEAELINQAKKEVAKLRIAKDKVDQLVNQPRRYNPVIDSKFKDTEYALFNYAGILRVEENEWEKYVKTRQELESRIRGFSYETGIKAIEDLFKTGEITDSERQNLTGRLRKLKGIKPEPVEVKKPSTLEQQLELAETERVVELVERPEDQTRDLVEILTEIYGIPREKAYTLAENSETTVSSVGERERMLASIAGNIQALEIIKSNPDILGIKPGRFDNYERELRRVQGIASSKGYTPRPEEVDSLSSLENYERRLSEDRKIIGLVQRPAYADQIERDLRFPFEDIDAIVRGFKGGYIGNSYLPARHVVHNAKLEDDSTRAFDIMDRLAKEGVIIVHKKKGGSIPPVSLNPHTRDITNPELKNLLDDYFLEIRELRTGNHASSSAK